LFDLKKKRWTSRRYEPQINNDIVKMIFSDLYKLQLMKELSCICKIFKLYLWFATEKIRIRLGVIRPPAREKKVVGSNLNPFTITLVYESYWYT
jgi:hypothetical protein